MEDNLHQSAKTLRIPARLCFRKHVLFVCCISHGTNLPVASEVDTGVGAGSSTKPVSKYLIGCGGDVALGYTALIDTPTE